MGKNTIYIVIGVVVMFGYYLFKKGIMKISKNFQWPEMVVTNTGLINNPNTNQRSNIKRLVKKVLQPARDLLGVPINITSGFRSEAVNASVGGASNSQHKLGLAADFNVTNMNLVTAFDKIRSSNIPYDQIIFERKPNSQWIHISYNPNGGRREQLLAVWNVSEGRMNYKRL